jgi:ankyrin repeat protein
MSKEQEPNEQKVGATIQWPSSRPEDLALFAALEWRRVELARLALSQGANPNAFNSRGWPALAWAARDGFEPAVALLTQAGADLEALSADGETALGEACCGGALGGAGCAEILIKAGARLDAKNWEDETALMHCARLGDAMGLALLLQAGADLGAVNHEGLDALALAQEHEQGECAALLEKEALSRMAAATAGFSKPSRL